MQSTSFSSIDDIEYLNKLKFFFSLEIERFVNVLFNDTIVCAHEKEGP